MFDVESRREFLRRAAAAGLAGMGVAGRRSLRAEEPAPAKADSPNNRLNIGVIGVAAQGGYNLSNVADQNIVALCDIDSDRLGAAAMTFPKAAKYSDYRKLLDRNDLDAVVVSTPDFSHAIPVVHALKTGRDVYCEKPLAHTVWEIRQMRKAAADNKRVTQMGTQIHAGDNYRRVVELIQAGAIGPVERVHVWQANAVRPGKLAPAGTKPPANIDYDLWIGPAPMRPFDPSHFHFNWRYWWDFGGGILADMGCHYIDLPYWALGLRNPTAIEAHGEKTYVGDNDVPDQLTADYYFPARGEQPPVHLTWYHGKRKPEGADVYMKGAAVLFEGTKGRLLADYGSHQLYMENGQSASTPEPTIPPSIGHHKEWVEACKTRGPTTCNFDYSGALAEAVLLGNVSYRAGQQRIEWDSDKLEVTNCPAAAQYLRREYRSGWTL